MEGYKLFFNFKKEPFKPGIDNDFFYLSSVHDEAIKLLEYAIKIRKDFVALLGEEGTGKTSLVKFLLNNLQDVEQSFVVNPFLNREEFLRYICSDFGVLLADDSNEDKVVEELNRFLISVYEKGKKAVVVIDDAHNLEVETLKLILHLSNMEKDNQKLVQFIFVGRPQFIDIINSEDELKQLKQRITLIIHLRPLIYEDIKNYIKNRIVKALGEEKDIFEEETYKLIYEYSGGIPLEINKLCNYALIFAFEERSKTVKKQHIEEAYKKLYPSRIKSVYQNEKDTNIFKIIVIGLIFIVVVSVAIISFNLVFKGSKDQIVKGKEVIAHKSKVKEEKKPSVKSENKTEEGNQIKVAKKSMSNESNNKIMKDSVIEKKSNIEVVAKEIDNKTENLQPKIKEKVKCVYFKVNQKLRTSPSLSSNTILVIPKNSNANFLKAENGWFFVNYKNYKGWVLHEKRFNELKECANFD